MERVIDKFILYICTVYVLTRTLGAELRPFLLYFTLAGTAALLWLIPGSRKPAGEDVDRDVTAGQWRVENRSPQGWGACILLDLAVLMLFPMPGLLGLLPLLVYDLILCRHWVGLGLSAAVFTNDLYQRFIREHGENPTADIEAYIWQAPSGTIIGIIAVLLLLAVWLSARTLQSEQDRYMIRHLRDDAAEQQQTLSRQNEALMEARDGEIMTAQLAERNRIAREIHDNVGHTLSRALLQVGALLAIHKEEPVHTQLTGVRETLDSAMNNIRTSVHDLHDSSVNLEATVRQMAEPLEGAFQVKVEIDVSEDMPREKKYGLIGILREGISNILRHSRNDAVLIQILEHPGFYQMILHDYLSREGSRRSAPVAGKESAVPGIGLTNIEARVRGMGGTVQITEEEGFRIFVSIPK